MASCRERLIIPAAEAVMVLRIQSMPWPCFVSCRICFRSPRSWRLLPQEDTSPRWASGREYWGNGRHSPYGLELMTVIVKAMDAHTWRGADQWTSRPHSVLRIKGAGTADEVYNVSVDPLWRAAGKL